MSTAKTGARQRSTRSGDLEAVLAGARGLQERVACLTVLCERGRPVTRERIGDLWRAACAAANVVDAQFRDIRAKAATYTDAAGRNATQRLGRASQHTTRVYLRGKRIIEVAPLKLKRG